MPDDFGFYGKGLSGYTHYTQGMKEADRRKNSNRGNRGGSGCLTGVVMVIGILVTFVAVVVMLLP